MLFSASTFAIVLSVLSDVSSAAILPRQTGSREVGNFYIDGTCPLAKINIIRDALTGAFGLADYASVIPATAAAYKKYIDPGPIDNTRHTTTKNRMTKMKTLLTPTVPYNKKVTVICNDGTLTGKDHDCSHGGIAFVPDAFQGDTSTGAGARIVLCNSFWEFRNLATAVSNCQTSSSSTPELWTLRNQAYTIVHELTHLRMFMNGGSRDCAYGTYTTMKLAEQAPWIAMLTADNWAYMSLAHYLSKPDVCNKVVKVTANGNPGGGETTRPDLQEVCAKDGSGLIGVFQQEHHKLNPIDL